MSNSKELRKMADCVGDFIRYWGFRRIHGEIWTILYLTNQALSGADLVKRLKVSKALVSPALSEMLDYKLIVQVGGDGKTKTYKAAEDVFQVIRTVLATREKSLIGNAEKQVSQLVTIANDGLGEIQSDRLNKLKDMIRTASSTLDMILLLASSREFSNKDIK